MGHNHWYAFRAVIGPCSGPPSCADSMVITILTGVRALAVTCCGKLWQSSPDGLCDPTSTIRWRIDIRRTRQLKTLSDLPQHWPNIFTIILVSIASFQVHCGDASYQAFTGVHLCVTAGFERIPTDRTPFGRRARRAILIRRIKAYQPNHTT